MDAITEREAITGKRSPNIQSVIKTYNKGEVGLKVLSAVKSDSDTGYLSRVMPILKGAAERFST